MSGHSVFSKGSVGAVPYLCLTRSCILSIPDTYPRACYIVRALCATERMNKWKNLIHESFFSDGERNWHKRVSKGLWNSQRETSDSPALLCPHITRRSSTSSTSLPIKTRNGSDLPVYLKIIVTPGPSLGLCREQLSQKLLPFFNPLLGKTNQTCGKLKNIPRRFDCSLVASFKKRIQMNTNPIPHCLTVRALSRLSKTWVWGRVT